MPPNPAAAGYNFTSTLRNDTYPAIDPTKLKLGGKYVFLSGASKGIGHAAAISFVKAGVAGIAIAARSDLSSLEREMHEAATAAGKPSPQIKSIRLDILDAQSIERAAQETSDTFGKLDILINNAGAMEEFKPTLDSDPEQWWQTWTVNIRGTYLLTRALLPLMLKGGDKQIIMLTSIGAFMPAPGGSGYQISKLALLRYAEYLNIEYGAQGVVAYGIHPGAIPTDIGLTMPSFLHHKLIDKPALAADTIVFLVSERREWLRGRYVSCTWDMLEFGEMEEEIVGGDKLKIRLAL
ncbi:hypothetical protein HO133_011057 [Letharia lupina]|uniref:Uncharacterized protein n=1 Tax=Letharia lupina TaxID=560253 RepID=A0A8H6FDM3_9LECA|nr:uncharacterized protein HO133_011057 [Letharia lupina]KAF6224480.1 hypothetical protein HO133_011057 [Letharia lupina]